MDNKELNRQLRENAINCGLCLQWQKEWEEDWDSSKMIHQFYRGLDFFLKHRYMSNDFMKENFDLEYLRGNGVLVDDKYSIANPEQSILLGNSIGVIRVNGFKASHVYVLDDSRLKISAKNKSFVIVHALGNASVDATMSDSARLVVILHSHSAKVTGNAVIKEEYDYLKNT